MHVTYHLPQSPAAAEPHEERKGQGLVVARDAEEEGHHLFGLCVGGMLSGGTINILCMAERLCPVQSALHTWNQERPPKTPPTQFIPWQYLMEGS